MLILSSDTRMSADKTQNQTRCKWAQGSELEQQYHDNEWGTPQHDDRILFEFIILEGMQAGLSWATILRKRENFREAFDGFDPSVVAAYGADKREELLQNAGIIRNRMKIDAAIANAQAFLRVQQEFGSFDSYIWAYVGGKPIVNSIAAMEDMPAETELSRLISKDLRKRGFKFVGPVIVYSFMQAVGMVNDHEDCCDFK